MATLAGQTNTKRGATSAPVSAHPAFPAIVALWFAALLGFGSLILPLVLLERLSTVSGLASLLPSAAPPLGFTARATVALGAAIAGAVLGLLLARQVAKGQAPKPAPRFSGEPGQCKPISAHEELGEAGLGAVSLTAAAKKRRSLAIAEDHSRSEYLQAAPLPGQDYLTQADHEAAEDEALELGDFAEPDEPHQPAGDQDFAMTDQDDESPLPATSPAHENRQEFAPPAPSLPQALDPLSGLEDEIDDEADEFAQDPVDALPFAPPSLRRSEVTESAAPDLEEETDEPEPIDFDPAPAAPALHVVAYDESEPVELAGEDQPLEKLGLVQLATRLGTAIERRRAARAAQADAVPLARQVFPPTTEDLDAAAAEDAAAARASFFGTPDTTSGDEGDEGPSAPGASFRSESAAAQFEDSPPAQSGKLPEVDFEDEIDEDDFALSFSLPLRSQRGAATMPASPSEPEVGAEEEQEDESQDEYSSLLSMKNPFEKKSEFVRVEEPEPEEDDFEATVTFPERRPEEGAETPRPFDPPAGSPTGGTAAAPRAQGDAERELRAALETLQRMSGAA